MNIFNSRSLRACGYVDNPRSPPLLTLMFSSNRTSGGTHPICKFWVLWIESRWLPKTFSALFRSFPYLARKKHTPQIWGWMPDVFIEQLSHLSTYELGYPQLLAGYPQKWAKLRFIIFGEHGYIWIHASCQRRLVHRTL